MTTEVHQFLIKGTSPLMQSNPEEMLLSEAAASTGTKATLARKKVIYDDREECEIRLYKYDGHYCHPTSAFRKAMSTAVTGLKWGKAFARMLITKSVFPTAEFVTLCGADGEPLTEYTTDKRSVVINGNARVIRCRPKFVQWMCILTVTIETHIVSVDQVLESLTLAGTFVGIGEYRPDSSGGKSGIGTFGRFTAALIVGPDAEDNGHAAKPKTRKKKRAKGTNRLANLQTA